MGKFLQIFNCLKEQQGDWDDALIGEPDFSESKKVKDKLYGYFWEPNKEFNNIILTEKSREKLSKEKNGIYVNFSKDFVKNEFKKSFPNKKSCIYIPENISDKFRQVINKEVNDIDNEKILEGYLRYTKYCLDYIYATDSGKKLLNDLISKRCTFIRPGIGNSCLGTSYCSLTSAILGKKKLDDKDNGEILRGMLIKKYNNGSSYIKLIDDIKKMPLYSLYTDQTSLEEKGFLKDIKINKEDIKKFIEEGIPIPIINNEKIEKVNINEFIKNAIIILLYDQSEEGIGEEVNPLVTFCVSTFNDNDINTIKMKPLAIALAHELIHAYNNIEKMQPGRDMSFHDYTLTELHCVGLGPWDKDRENRECKVPDYSENKIREEWKTKDFNNLPEDSKKYLENDKLNNRDYSSIKRKIYQYVDNPESAREKSQSI